MKPLAMVFDLFGTLLDIASLQAAAARYAGDAAAFVATWREKQLAYAFAASMMDRYEDFDALTIRALRYAAARHGLGAAGDEWETLAGEWCRVAPFDDARPALTQLREHGAACAVLTNGTPLSARAALEFAGLSDCIDAILSVDTVRVYKPDARVYALATAHFQTTADRIVFVSSNGWDATGAAEFGLRVAWCNRAHAPAETFGTAPEWTIRDLGDLPNIVVRLEDSASEAKRTR